MPQHMRMNWEWKASALPCSCQHLPETCRCHRAGALGEKDIAPFGLLTSEPSQIADLTAAEWVHARHSVLEPLHVHETLRKVDLIPAQRAEFRRAEAMPICDQDHCCIAVPVPAAITCGFPEQLDLFLGQVLARPPRSVWLPCWRDCPIYSVWHRLPCPLFCLDYPSSCFHSCPIYSQKWNSPDPNHQNQKWPKARSSADSADTSRRP